LPGGWAQFSSEIASDSGHPAAWKAFFLLLQGAVKIFFEASQQPIGPIP
jgi:hypothetical protein